MYYAPEFEHFTFDQVLDGVIDARDEEPADVIDGCRVFEYQQLRHPCAVLRHRKPPDSALVVTPSGRSSSGSS
jgi:hypothetical protein